MKDLILAMTIQEVKAALKGYPQFAQEFSYEPSWLDTKSFNTAVAYEAQTKSVNEIVAYFKKINGIN